MAFPDVSSAGNPLPESDKDRAFLLELPEDLHPAALQLGSTLEPLVLSDHPVFGVEAVSHVKKALGLPLGAETVRAQTIVIMNAINEVIDRYGFLNPEMIIFRLQERRRVLEETLGAEGVAE
jgi:hypothetical protein